MADRFWSEALYDQCRCPPDKGHSHPRIFPKPLRELTPDTTDGFAFLSFCKVLGLNLFPWQKFLALHALERMQNGHFRFRNLVFLLPRQNGKLVTDSTPMLTQRGWTTHGDLRVGDQVHAVDGTLSTITGVFPQGVKRLYRVTLTDGTSLDAGAEHLWTVKDRRNYSKDAPEWETLTTAQIMDKGLEMPSSREGHRDYRFRVPPRPTLERPSAELLLDPYLLGVWLGDGSATGGTITGSPEKQAFWRPLFDAAGFPTSTRTSSKDFGVNKLLPTLRYLGVLGNKHVPEEYMIASAEQRTALVQGLLDSDGYVSASGQVESTTKKWQAEALVWLLRSLGQRPTIQEKQVKLKGWEEPRTYCRVLFSPANGFVPFRRPEHLARLKPARADRTALSIASIEEVESAEASCIMIDHPSHTYLAGRDLVPTHNSTFVAMLIAWFLTVKRSSLILGAAQNLQTAEEIWTTVGNLIETHPVFKGELARPITMTNGAKAITLTEGRRYLPIAAVGGAGRGFSPELVFLDELREHHNWEAYSSLAKATMAQPDALTIAATNAGEAKSIVLSHLVAQGREMIKNEDQVGVGLFDWSAYEFDDKDADPGLFENWRKSNPSLGYSITRETLHAAFMADPRPVFLTECLCIPVEILDAVIDVAALFLTADPYAHTLRDELGKGTVIAHLEVSPDVMHATLTGAIARPEGKVRMQPLKTWSGTNVLLDMERELRPLLDALAPYQVQRYVGNPGAQAAAGVWLTLRGLRRVDIPMAESSDHSVRFAAMVASGRVEHPGSSLLVAQARTAARKMTGETWRFARTSREGGNYVDALYSAAGACAVAETRGIVATTIESIQF